MVAGADKINNILIAGGKIRTEELEIVRAKIAIQEVTARAAAQRVGACRSVHCVIAGFSVQRGASAITEIHLVIARAAIHEVSAGFARDKIIAHQRVIVIAAIKHVIAAEAPDQVLPGAAIGIVNARRGGAGQIVVHQQRIVAVSATDKVIAVAAVKGIIAVPAAELVIAAKAADRIIAAPAVQPVGYAIAGDPVAIIRALDIFDVDEKVAEDRRRNFRRQDIDIGCEARVARIVPVRNNI